MKVFENHFKGITNLEKKFFQKQHLYKFRCGDAFLKSIEEFKFKVDWNKCQRLKGFNKFKGSRVFYGKNFSLKNEESLCELHKWIEECLYKVKEDIEPYKKNISQLLISQSWMNCSSKGEVHNIHTHTLSILSGILYLTEPSNTIFHFDSIYGNQFLFPKEDFFETYNYQAKKGELIIFPSTVPHYVGPHLDNKPRYSMAFNTWFKGSMGNKYTANYIPKEFT
mgnify:CR=1 FL=1